MEWITSPEAWIALTTLTLLEIVLGVDNIIFISILVGRLPEAQRPRARLLGLGFAMGTRILLLLLLTWIMRLQATLFSVLNVDISGRDLILIGGGLFLLAKSTLEIHESLEGVAGDGHAVKQAGFVSVIIQIGLIDIVFSLDSVITAVGLADDVSCHDHRDHHRRRRHDVRCRRDRPLRRQSPHRKDAGAELPRADRRGADRRGHRRARSEGLHLLRDGVLGHRRDAEYPDSQRHASRCS